MAIGTRATRTDSRSPATSARWRRWRSGFFDDLVIAVDGNGEGPLPARRHAPPRSSRKLKPAFDRKSGSGTITAGNASPLTDGAAAIWVATDAGLARLPANRPRAKLVDWEIAAVDVFHEGLLMAPAYAIPRLLARNGLTLDAIDLWEIHEAFAAQVLCNVAALERETSCATRCASTRAWASFRGSA